MPFWPALLAVTTVLATAYMAVAWCSAGRWWAVIVAGVIVLEAAAVAVAAQVVTRRALARSRARAERWSQLWVPFVVPDHATTEANPSNRDC